MSFEPSIPEMTQKTLARLGAQIERTDHFPSGVVNLTHSEVTNDDLKDLVFYPGFQALILNETLISDVGLSAIGEMVSLESLLLNSTLVSDQGLHELSHLRNLEELQIGCLQCCLRGRPAHPKYVKRNQISDQSFVALVDFPGLRKLNLMATRIRDEGLERYAPELSKLENLSLAYTQISDRGLKALDSLQWLESIDLKHTAITNQGIVEFAQSHIRTLRRLTLANTAVINSSLRQFLPDAQLDSLDLNDTAISDRGCRQIGKCRSLNYLRLNLTDVTDVGMRDIANCTQLRSLSLFGTQITDTSLVWLSELGLDYLGLGRTLITDAGMPTLLDFPNLRSLDLEGTLISDRGLRYLSPLKSLKQLYLDFTCVTNEGLPFLLDIPLQALSLNCFLDQNGLKTLSQHASLQQLAIYNTNLDNCEALRSLSSLKVLLIDNTVQDLSALEEMKQLTHLLLWGDSFSPSQVARLRLELSRCVVAEFKRNDPARREFEKLCPLY